MEHTQAEVAAQESGGTRSGGSSGKKRRRILGIVFALPAAAYIGLCIYAVSLSTTFPGMQAGGTPVGGMTASQAEAALTKEGLAVSDQPFTLYLTEAEDSQQLTADPAELSFSDLGGVEIDPSRTAQRAYEYCHGGNFFQSGWRYLTCLLGRGSVEKVLTAPQLSALAEELAKACSRSAIDTSYTLKEDGLFVTVARDGYSVDPRVLTDSIQDRLAEGPFVSMDCPTVYDEAKTLTAQDIYDAVAGEVQNAGYDAATDTITPERAGVAFDPEAAQKLMDAAAPGQSVQPDAEIQLPAVTARELKAVLFRDVLGTATTHVGGTAARISNVKLSAASVNGTVLNCGETFSYNDAVGQRTAAKGYQPAPAYVKGETVDEIGGGICQTSSTLYLASLRSNLNIAERYAHRYAPAYIEWGMDATVSWNGPDYKFTNNTNYPIRIVTVYSKGYLTVKLLGTKTDDTTVKMTHKTLSTTPYETVYQDDPTLPAGTETVKVTPYTGCKVESYRSLYDSSGNLIASNLEDVSNYKSRDKLILKGPSTAEPPAADADAGAGGSAAETGGEAQVPDAAPEGAAAA